MKRSEEKSDQQVGSDVAISLLFQKALAGDALAYRTFLEEVAKSLRSFLARVARTTQAEKIEDLVQEVLLAIHRKRDLYRPGMPVMPWVRAIAKHRMIDSIRSEKRRPELVELSEEIESAFSVEQPIESFYDIDALLECLDERQRQILKLAKVEEVPLEEIARRLGISHSLVKVTVHRSLKKVRESIDE
jgi:RNA polymerase sigma-70 factor (ECF subfamily)